MSIRERHKPLDVLSEPHSSSRRQGQAPGRRNSQGRYSGAGPRDRSRTQAAPARSSQDGKADARRSAESMLNRRRKWNPSRDAA
jgi:hypothetical protein